MIVEEYRESEELLSEQFRVMLCLVDSVKRPRIYCSEPSCMHTIVCTRVVRYGILVFGPFRLLRSVTPAIMENDMDHA